MRRHRSILAPLLGLLACSVIGCTSDEEKEDRVCQWLFAEHGAQYAVDSYQLTEDTEAAFTVKGPEGQVFYYQMILDDTAFRATAPSPS